MFLLYNAVKVFANNFESSDFPNSAKIKLYWWFQAHFPDRA